MTRWTRAVAGTALSLGLLAGTWAVPATAAPDGKVSLVAGKRVVIKDAPIDRATKKAAVLCGGRAADHVRAAGKADRTGTIVIVCSRGTTSVYFRP